MPGTEVEQAAMSPAELERLIAASVEAGTPVGELAKKVGYTRQQFWHLRTGRTIISTRAAHVFRQVLKPQKERKEG